MAIDNKPNAIGKYFSDFLKKFLKKLESILKIKRIVDKI